MEKLRLEIRRRRMSTSILAEIKSGIGKAFHKDGSHKKFSC